MFWESSRRQGGTFTLERNRFEAKGRAVGAAIDVVWGVKSENRRSWFCFPKCRRGEVKARSFEAATPLRPANCGKSTRKRRSQKCCRKGVDCSRSRKAQCLVWREVVSVAVSVSKEDGFGSGQRHSAGAEVRQILQTALMCGRIGVTRSFARWSGLVARVVRLTSALVRNA